MYCDIILFFNDLTIQNLNLFYLEKKDYKISFRYILFCNTLQYDIFQELYHDHPHIYLFCIGSLKHFHYITFHLFLKSNVRKPTDLYIITNEISPIILNKFFEEKMPKTLICRKQEKKMFVLASEYFDIFTFPTSLNLYLWDCFEWKNVLVG